MRTTGDDCLALNAGLEGGFGAMFDASEGVGKMRIDVACGGTGGHVLPGVATARVLSARGHAVRLWLTARDVEADAAGGWEGPVLTVAAAGFAAGAPWRWPAAAWGLWMAVCRSLRLMRADPPAALLAMGSYACVGPALAARRLGVPVVVHEGNAVPGRAVALLARFATVVAVAFKGSTSGIRARRVVLTGLPLRGDLDQRFEPGELRNGVPTVLVTGGSQGAQRLNSVTVDALRILRERGVDVQVIHLAGRRNEESVRQAYEGAGVDARVYGFLKEVGKAYHSATLAISRSGTATCAELCACGVPSLLVPLPTAARNHQVGNARELERDGGAEVIEERGLTAEGLADRLESCLRDRGTLERMSAAMREAAMPDAADRLADVMETIGKGESVRTESTGSTR